MSPKKYRWYIVVAIAWPVFLFVVALPFSLAMQALDHPRVRSEIWSILLAILYASLIVGMILWIFWVVPLLAVTDMPRRSKLPPVKRILGIRLFMAMPGVLILALIGIGFSMGVSLESLTGIGWFVGIVLIMVGGSLSDRAIRRLREACIRERICFKCGYDLQGSPSLACPECGYDSGTAS